jgi:hypothetical protein
MERRTRGDDSHHSLPLPDHPTADHIGEVTDMI